MKLRSYVCVLALPLVSGACSLLLDTDRLVGTGTTDAGHDAAADGGTPDVGSPDGGAQDGGSACEGGFCACSGGGHTFCDDFDKPPPFTTAWTVTQAPGGSIAYVTDNPFSPPTSVLARSNAMTTGNLTEEISLIDMPAVTRIRVEVDMGIEVSDPATNPSGQDGHSFCPISITLKPGFQTFRLNVYANSANVEQLSGTNPIGAQVVSGVPVGSGARGRFGLWLDTKARTCGLSFNGAEKLTGCVLDKAFVGGSATVEMGIIFVRPPTNAWQVRMDNVLIDHD